VIILGHTYKSITAADRTFTPVSDVTPSGTVEEKFTWANIAGWTWADLHNSGKIRWCDWYYGTKYADNYTSITTPSATYSSKTRSDRTYSSITTPSQTYNEVTK